MALAGIMAGADGLMVESHIAPEESISDAQQTISMEVLEEIMKTSKELWRYR